MTDTFKERLLSQFTDKNPVIFITGTDTDIGKTVVSGVLTKQLGFDYWKPIQCGELDSLDSDFVRSLIDPSKTTIHKENVLLQTPASPHLAAKLENRKLTTSDFDLPTRTNGLVMEGAGGIIVPINEEGLTIYDLIQEKADGVILVTKHYLGSLNHTLLSIDKLKQGNVPIIAVVFNGDSNEESEKIIMKMNPDIVNWLRLPLSEDLANESLTFL